MRATAHYLLAAVQLQLCLWSLALPQASCLPYGIEDVASVGADSEQTEAVVAPDGQSAPVEVELTGAGSVSLLAEPSYAGKEIYLLEDKDYPKSLYEHYPGVGQVSGIAALPSGDLALFHRADRQWSEDLFHENHTVVWNATSGSPQENLIKNDTITIIDGKNGGSMVTFGSGLFYMPHSIASDNRGNLWVSDVARHQVMRLPVSGLRQADRGASWLSGSLWHLWPDIVLGEAFVPGSDRQHFCQPAEIEVSSDGNLVFVADGYCNQRIMVFTGQGKFLTSFGDQLGFKVVHSLTIFEERNLICAADRENERIFCFKAGLDGDLESIGELMLTVEYPLGKVFAIESISEDHMVVSSNQVGTRRYDIAALNPFASELKQIWTSSDLLEPHSMVRSSDGQFVYVADMSKDAYKKIFKFNIIQRL